ncbi:MAG: methionine aminotransferase [Cyclobacteriaceae bacterium]|jgi:methionine aminotransferase|nr:methionine aminotransferase [Cyclobacteriaceae bacterium]
MSKMALEENALNLSQGFPDFPVSPELIEAIHRQMCEGHNQYAPMPGVPALRQVIAQVIEKTYQRKTDPETEVTITAGGTEALFAAIAALVHPGDEVIVFDPAYDSYDPAIRLSGGVPVHINLRPPHFAIPWEEVKSRMPPRTRLILVNSPHNPTGAVLSPSDWQHLETLALQHDLLVLSDEVYERLIFDGLVHQSALASAALANRSVAVFSFGKTFHATGWKVGYAVAAPALTAEIRKAHQFITFSVNTPVQWALAEYMQTDAHYLHLGRFYQRKRDLFLEQLNGSSFKPLPCRGSYFQLVAYEDARTDRQMAEHLTRVHKVAPIPVSAFYRDGTDHKLLRFCFAKQDETLARAGTILRAC